MSNMLKDCPFFPVPWHPVRIGILRLMKGSEAKLWLALMHDFERYRTRELIRTDAQLKDLCCVSPRALRDARIKLQEYGLVLLKRGVAGMYRYTDIPSVIRELASPFPVIPKMKEDTGLALPTQRLGLTWSFLEAPSTADFAGPCAGFAGLTCKFSEPERFSNLI